MERNQGYNTQDSLNILVRNYSKAGIRTESAGHKYMDAHVYDSCCRPSFSNVPGARSSAVRVIISFCQLFLQDIHIDDIIRRDSSSSRRYILTLIRDAQFALFGRLPISCFPSESAGTRLYIWSWSGWRKMKDLPLYLPSRTDSSFAFSLSILVAVVVAAIVVTH